MKDPRMLPKPEGSAGEKLRETPQPSSNPASRHRQRRDLQKKYLARRRKQQAERERRAARAAEEKAEQAGRFLWRHRKGFAIAAAIFVTLFMMLSGFSSCSVMFQSAGSAVTGSTYPSRDADMLSAEAVYTAKETELEVSLENYESTHSYDEYHFELDEIGHDPYVLISLLTSWQGGEWTAEEVRDRLDALFEQQYVLTETVVREVRYCTETREDGSGGTVTEEVPYDYYICTVTLENRDLSHLPVCVLSEEQLSQYAVYMASQGNRPDLFPQGLYPNASVREEYLDYDVPPALLEDERFAAMLREAEKYLGFPYVWGGSKPSTSFDCSGFVSWVINHSGWNVGRRSADGLCRLCTPIPAANAQPGDLIFFEKTYQTAGASHVGIYVGNSMMIHCGDPISYANINADYWQQHFYTFGRLPQP